MCRIKSTLALALAFTLPVLAHSQNDWANFTRYREANASTLDSGVTPRAVFMGDSITEGWYSMDAEFFDGNNYAARGISGQTTSQMVVRFRRDVLDLKPKYVVILAGTNDIAMNNGPIELENIFGNIVSMCEIAQAHHIRPILCSVLPATSYSWRKQLGDPSEKIISLNSMIESYARQKGFKYVDFHSAMKDGSNGLLEAYGNERKDGKRDSVHPGIDGYKVMEGIIVKYLK